MQLYVKYNIPAPMRKTFAQNCLSVANKKQNNSFREKQSFSNSPDVILYIVK